MMKEILPIAQVENLIFEIRGKKVILDTDLARLYGVETKMLKRAIRRNIERFPNDFLFELSRDEFTNLRCQFGTSSDDNSIEPSRHGGARYLPFALTEHGAIMAASVLNTPKAVEMSIYVVRAFVNLRSIYLQHKEIAQKVVQLEAKLTRHDDAIGNII